MPAFGRQEHPQGLLRARRSPENASMRLLCQVTSKDLSDDQTEGSQGFVLLEVIVAMSLILGSWMALLGTYQNLALRTAQVESKRAQLRREFDTFEIGEQLRLRVSTNTKGQNHESSRVYRRHRAQHATTQSTSQNQR
jgi:type II secretory pathway component PulJ